MGVVYKAKDIKLNRTVALKFLPPELTHISELKERSKREAQAAAALDHPNICTVYEFDDTEEKTFISMAYIEGQSLRERIESGPLNLDEALNIAIQVAEGLQEAHMRGVVHRDIKSANIMVTERDQAKIMDFGLAKVRGSALITKEATTMGTAAYMSPEQARGKDVDHRTDIWSFGVVLYEMIAGQLPFKGDNEQAVVYSILNEGVEPLKKLRSDVSEELQQIVFRTLEKDPKKRYQSAHEVLQHLKKLSDRDEGSGAKIVDARALLQLLKRPKIALAVLAIFLLLATAVFVPYQKRVKLQQARELIPLIEKLAEERKYFEAYELAVQAEKVIKNDSTLVGLMPIISDDLTIITQPEGAGVYLKRFAPDERGNFPEREHIGITPINHLLLARGDYKLAIEKEGFVPVEHIASSALNRNEATFGVSPNIKIEIKLHRVEDIAENMVFIPEGDYQLASSKAPTTAKIHLDDYFIDKYEISNKQYEEFTNAGGYVQKMFWKYSFIENGKTLSWEEAMQHFTDRTGLPGPRSWVNQEYPEGKANYPVTDITWYEASAYAEFAGKSLPTIFQWEKAARDRAVTHFVGQVMPWGLLSAKGMSEYRGNFEGRDTTPVDSYEFGLSPYGCYNMAGNVKEWCLNEMTGGFTTTGGSWEEPEYMFYAFGALPGFYSSRAVGFRCVKMSVENIRDQGAMRINIDVLTPSYSPVDEATFESFLSHYQYDRRPLDVQVVETKETDDWRREKVTFAGLEDDRIIAYIYLPKRAAKPFQCISLMPGYDVFLGRTIPEYVQWFLAPHIKAGRAVMAVVQKGAVERPLDQERILPSPISSVKYRDRIVYWSTEYSIGIDYLATRGDIDMDKIAHIGFSIGASYLGIIHTAVEDRYRSIVFVGGGIFKPMLPALPEANQVNFAPHVKPPKLVLHGKYDEILVYKTMTIPLYELIAEPKRLELVDGGHMPPLEIRVPIINNWLDETLGPIKFK
jgi:formylglycine-generating enzyme required for sulfatase activity